MNCDETRQKLSPYIEGLLSFEDKELVEEHLNTCKGCEVELENLTRTIEVVKGLEEVEPPPWLAEVVMERVKTEAEKEKGLLQRLFHPFVTSMPLQAAATILIAIGVVFIFKSFESEVMEVTEILPSDDTAHVVLEDEEITEEPIVAKRDVRRKTQAPQAPVSRKSEFDLAADALKIEKEAKVSAQEAPSAPTAQRRMRAEVPAEGMDRQLEEGIAVSGIEMKEAEPEREIASKTEIMKYEADYRAKGQRKSEDAVDAYVPPPAGGESVTDVVAPPSSALADRRALPRSFTVVVEDIERASEDIAEIVKRINGELSKTTFAGGKKFLTIRLDAKHLDTLLQDLRKIGEMKEKKAEEIVEGEVIVEIAITDKSAAEME